MSHRCLSLWDDCPPTNPSIISACCHITVHLSPVILVFTQRIEENVMISLEDQPHRRYDPLKDEWVIVSPHRIQRPWQGATESVSDDVPAFDPKNPLCPGVVRANGERTADYEGTFAFTNDFSALLPDAQIPQTDAHPLFRTSEAKGTCRVMCFHPRSDLTLATMDRRSVRVVVDGWLSEFRQLCVLYNWVQLFENKGAIVGCSNPHPHCQIWASQFLPNEPATKDRTQREYMQKYGTVLLLDYVQQELKRAERVVFENDHWVVLVPFWAVWPYETMLLPKRHVLRLTDLNEAELDSVCEAMQALLIRYDNLFKCSFPYSMGWHGAPTGLYLDKDCSHWQLHAIYLPPLLRSATVKKFIAGYELVCEPQRDLTAENAAKTLRELSSVHYKKTTF